MNKDIEDIKTIDKVHLYDFIANLDEDLSDIEREVMEELMLLQHNNVIQ